VTAVAYVNHGRWIADCTRPYCANAEKLEPHQSVFCCSNCRQIDDVRWPADPDKVWAVLEARPVPQTRNWAPAGHRQAITDGFPDGQTVADLVDENREYGDI
jgi:hypothetical protein